MYSKKPLKVLNIISKTSPAEIVVKVISSISVRDPVPNKC